MSEMIWAAGLFEGEGCVTFSNGEHRGVSLHLLMNDEDVVRRFHRAVGVGRVRINHRLQWLWTVASLEDTERILADFWPWLGKRRRKRAYEVLGEVASRRAERRNTRTRNTLYFEMFGKSSLADLTPLEFRRYQAEVARRHRRRKVA